MKTFCYKGELSVSKSIVNRGLVVNSLCPQFKLQNFSEAEDVIFLNKSFEDFKKGSHEFDCGSGGTTFRFLLTRLSRTPGTYFVKADERLLDRPHEELFSVLSKLNCKITKRPGGVEVDARGWGDISRVSVDCSKSSQFASALILCSLGRDFATEITLIGRVVSKSYLKMTLSFLKELNVPIKIRDDRIQIAKNSVPLINTLNVDADASSVFALACHAAIDGRLEVLNCYPKSLQPDHKLINKMTELGVKVEWSKGHLNLLGCHKIRPVEWDLSDNPDAFPVLAVLLARASGVSVLSGLETLKYKESNRLENTVELLRSFNCKVELISNVVRIFGSETILPVLNKQFNPDKDHRMAMAASLGNYFGAKQEIVFPEVVNKSFPEFWNLVNS